MTHLGSELGASLREGVDHALVRGLLLLSASQRQRGAQALGLQLSQLRLHAATEKSCIIFLSTCDCGRTCQPSRRCLQAPCKCGTKSLTH